MPTTTQPAPKAAQRLPQYLAYLKVRRKKGETMVSSTIIAEDLRLNPVQVRKDLALASHAGRPKTGYPIDTLIEDLERYLGYHNTQDAFVVGVGRLGGAMMANRQFAEYGLNILAGFDANPALHGQEIDGKPVFPMDKLPNLIERMQVYIAILTVPAATAQDACRDLLAGGIRAIWNFSSAQLDVPEGVLVQNENLAISFANLSTQLASALHQEGLEGGNHT